MKLTGIISATLLAIVGTAVDASAEPVTFEWTSTSGFIGSIDRQLIEEVTGQAAFPVQQFWVVEGSMNGVFTYAPENAQPPQVFGNFTYYFDAHFDAAASLFSAGTLIGSIAGGQGNVAVSDNGGGQSGSEDVVNVFHCCGLTFTVGAWRATSASVVWVGDGFQDGTGIPPVLPPAGAPAPLAFFSFHNEATGVNATIFAINIDVREAVQTVSVDVKPGSDSNCVNVNGNGVIPVAILGDPALDVAAIDPGTLNFGGLDVRVRGNDSPQCGIEDVNGDGVFDLVCQFVDDPLAWVPGNDTVTLTGSLFDGSPITGEDAICIVP